MFSGIIQEVGAITAVANAGSGLRITIEAPQSVNELNLGDSVAVNGVCQTVIQVNGRHFAIDSVKETLSKTTMSSFVSGTIVNIETALKVGTPIGGHIIQGHVDAVGTIRALNEVGNSWMMNIELPENLQRYVVPMGSIAIDGVSLTVAGVSGNIVTIAVIPHTMQNTTFRLAKSGSKVNIECDLIGKYVERLIVPYMKERRSARINGEMLRSWGYENDG